MAAICCVEHCERAGTHPLYGFQNNRPVSDRLCDEHYGSLDSQLGESGHGLDDGYLVKRHPLARPGDRRFTVHD